MAKTALNVKNNRSTLQSIREVPFTGAEIKELQLIQEKGYSARKALKEEFCDRNNRMITEVNEYFMKHKNPPKVGKAGSYTRKLEIPESTPAPREQVVNTTGQIKVTFKSMRVDGNVITFEL